MKKIYSQYTLQMGFNNTAQYFGQSGYVIRTNWLWIRIPLQSFKVTLMQI